MKSKWQRLVYEKQAIYVHKHSADWFVPNAAADALLQRDDKSPFLARISAPNPEVYTPRAQTSHALHEFWIHLTNRCNLTCNHCLFSSSPSEKETLSLSHIIPFIDEAYALGARLFVLSGGEPLVHLEILPLLEHLFALKGVEVVILSNGILVGKIFTCKNFLKERLYFHIGHDRVIHAQDAL